MTTKTDYQLLVWSLWEHKLFYSSVRIFVLAASVLVTDRSGRLLDQKHAGKCMTRYRSTLFFSSVLNVFVSLSHSSSFFSLLQFAIPVLTFCSRELSSVFQLRIGLVIEVECVLAVKKPLDLPRA